MTIRIEITGNPVAKGRAKTNLIRKMGGGFVTDSKGRPVLNHRTPEKTRRWEDDARMMARQAMAGKPPLSGPILAVVRATFAPPSGWPAWKREAATARRIAHTVKPDGDNLVKAAFDALNGVVWIDDAQVITHEVHKLYGDKPGVVIEVEPFPAAPAQVSSRAEFNRMMQETA